MMKKLREKLCLWWNRCGKTTLVQYLAVVNLFGELKKYSEIRKLN